MNHGDTEGTEEDGRSMKRGKRGERVKRKRLARRYEAPKLDAPPVYATTANDSIASFVSARRRRRRKGRAEEPEDIVATKGSASYRAHTYHTKVPPEGITPFIERYSQPGDVVLDPFCGSGMTGVAALSAGRRAVLVDLSPAATFIAANYCARPDPERLLHEAETVLDAVRPELEPLYATRCRACGQEASIRFTVWSERCGCPECGEQFSLWDVARAGRRVRGVVACPACKREASRGQWELLDPEEVLVKYTCPDCGSSEAPPDDADRELAARADAGDWDARLAYPMTAIPERGDEIARVHNQGIHRVDQLFTRRNLRAVAALWHAIESLPDLACRQQLFFALTASMPRASRTNKYIPALGMAPGPVLGTMYIPGFHPELNVLSLFKRKVADAVRYYRQAPPADPEVAVRISTQSAADLANIPDGSIDYVFTDPPFGSNIAYSELNLLWESWLGVRTDVAREAVVSRTQRKSVDDYEGLMADAFREVGRVLRPGGRFSIVFHNTSAEVWRALQGALDAAGFAVESAVTFDKGPNQSFKQFTAEGAVTHDLVVTCGRASSAPRLPFEATEADVLAFLRDALAALPGKPDARKLYSAAIAHFLLAGRRVPVGYKDFRKLLAGLSGEG